MEGGMRPPTTRRARTLVELEAQIQERRRSARRHTLWAMLGVSPAGLLPMLGLGWDFGFGGVVVAGVFITGIEAWRAVQAHADLREAEEAVRKLAASSDEPGSARQSGSR